MSERRPDEMTDPGPPPEEALDATLRALGAPVAAQPKRTPDSAGLDAAHYHVEPHHPPRAHEPASSSKVTTEPTAESLQAKHERDTLRMQPREQGRHVTTTARAAPLPSRTSVFAGALMFVVLLLGVGAWALTRSPDASASRVSASASVATVVSALPTSAPSASVVDVLPPPAPSASVVDVLPPPAPSASVVHELPTSAPSAPVVDELPTSASAALIANALPTSAPSASVAVGFTTPGPVANAPARSAQPTTAASAPPVIRHGASAAAAPTTSPAPTSKYNHLLNEDKQ